MYETQTYDAILKRVLARANGKVDTSEGSIFFDAVAPCCAEIAQIYIELDDIIKQSYADTADREYLILRASERGLKPSEATNAIMKLETTPSSIEIAIGSRFTLENYSYKVISKVENGVYQAQCEQSGADPNGMLGLVVPVNYINNLERAEITQALILGKNEEETEDFRARYFNSFDAQAFGGNKADYIAKTNSLQGVGSTKVTPTWNGKGTVKLTVLDSEYNKATETLIEYVQNAIDPTNDGSGTGLAPIGHVVTVNTAEEVVINVSSTFTLSSGYTFEMVKPSVEDEIKRYLLELRKTWADNDSEVVRIAQIDSRLVNIQGIDDLTGTKINGVSSNVTLNNYQIGVFGGVTQND